MFLSKVSQTCSMGLSPDFLLGMEGLDITSSHSSLGSVCDLQQMVERFPVGIPFVDFFSWMGEQKVLWPGWHTWIAVNLPRTIHVCSCVLVPWGKPAHTISLPTPLCRSLWSMHRWQWYCQSGKTENNFFSRTCIKRKKHKCYGYQYCGDCR